jgi:hypothetical protein
MGKALGETTSSSSGCGGPSNTRRNPAAQKEKLEQERLARLEKFKHLIPLNDSWCWRHCEERSAEAIQKLWKGAGLLSRFASGSGRNDGLHGFASQ